MKQIFFALIALQVLLSGCLGEGNQGEDDLRFYKGIPSAEIPGECLEQRHDVCALFDCMVEGCWCDDSTPSGAILSEGRKLVETTDAAKTVVTEYLQAHGEGNYVVQKAVKLNNVFYNVFALDENGDEKVLTIAADGTVIKTICGV
jgi:hypothetical protein